MTTPISDDTFLLFAEITGCAKWHEHLSGDELAYSLERCLNRMTRSLETNGGRVIETGYTSLLVTFDNVEQCCKAAIDMQTRVSQLPPTSGINPAIRIGLYRGQAEGGQYTKATLNNAAKIIGMAAPKQILLSSSVLLAIRSNSELPIKTSGKAIDLEENGKPLTLHEICWFSEKEVQKRGKEEVHDTQLTFHYRGRVYKLTVQGSDLSLDEHKKTTLSIGRDKNCDVWVLEHMASRRHAKIESDKTNFYLIETSSNGTFIKQEGQPERLIVKGRQKLIRKGRLNFGSPSDDPDVEFAYFEIA